MNMTQILILLFFDNNTNIKAKYNLNALHKSQEGWKMDQHLNKFQLLLCQLFCSWVLGMNFNTGSLLRTIIGYFKYEPLSKLKELVLSIKSISWKIWLAQLQYLLHMWKGNVDAIFTKYNHRHNLETHTPKFSTERSCS